MNRAFSEAGWPDREDGADRLGPEYVRNLYDVLDRLRADHPALRIETCSGGGGRVDLGILSRTDQAWASDNTDAADRMGIQQGYGQIYPARTMGAWVTDVPNQLTGRTVPLRFRFHVAMAGALGIGVISPAGPRRNCGRAPTWSPRTRRSAISSSTAGWTGCRRPPRTRSVWCSTPPRTPRRPCCSPTGASPGTAHRGCRSGRAV